jgi:hypothetical protein
MTTELTLTEIEAAEFNLVDQISKLPAAAKRKRDQALEVLAKLRDVKGRLLARNPDLLRKGSAVALKLEPSWRGLPVDNIAAKTMATEARDRQAEDVRLGKHFGPGGPGGQTPQVALDTMKRALRAPTATGNAGMTAFLIGRAGR